MTGGDADADPEGCWGGEEGSGPAGFDDEAGGGGGGALPLVWVGTAGVDDVGELGLGSL